MRISPAYYSKTLMKVESIAECSPWSILQYFRPALSDNRYRKAIFVVLFEWALKTRFTVKSNEFFELSVLRVDVVLREFYGWMIIWS